jgi:hypothetical protein
VISLAREFPNSYDPVLRCGPTGSEAYFKEEVMTLAERLDIALLPPPAGLTWNFADAVCEMIRARH